MVSYLVTTLDELYVSPLTVECDVIQSIFRSRERSAGLHVFRDSHSIPVLSKSTRACASFAVVRFQ